MCPDLDKLRRLRMQFDDSDMDPASMSLKNPSPNANMEGVSRRKTEKKEAVTVQETVSVPEPASDTASVRKRSSKKRPVGRPAENNPKEFRVYLNMRCRMMLDYYRLAMGGVNNRERAYNALVENAIERMLKQDFPDAYKMLQGLK